MLCLTVGSASMAAAQRGREGGALSDTFADSAVVAALDRQIESAIARADTAFLQRVLSPAFILECSDPSGLRETRSDYFERMSIPLRERPWTEETRLVDSVIVTIDGKLARSSGRIRVMRSGKDSSSNFVVGYEREYEYSEPAGDWRLTEHRVMSDVQSSERTSVCGAPP